MVIYYLILEIELVSETTYEESNALEGSQPALAEGLRVAYTVPGNTGADAVSGYCQILTISLLVLN